MRTLISILFSCLSLCAQGPSAFGVRQVAMLQAMNPILYPTQVSGLMMWVSADFGCYSNAGINLCTDPGGSGGTDCQRWSDRSGNGNDLGKTTAGTMPRFMGNAVNGLPCLQFGSGSFRNMTNSWPATINPPYTIFLVFYPSNTAQVGTMIDGRASNTRTWVYAGGTSIHSDNGHDVPIFETEQGKWQQVTAVMKRFNSFGCFDAKRGFGTDNNALNGFNSTGVRVGATYIPDQEFPGLIAEVIFYNKALNQCEQYGVETYLKRKYAFSNPF